MRMKLENNDAPRVIVAISERVKGKFSKKSRSFTLYDTTQEEVLGVIENAIKQKAK